MLLWFRYSVAKRGDENTLKTSRNNSVKNSKYPTNQLFQEMKFSTLYDLPGFSELWDQTSRSYSVQQEKTFECRDPCPEKFQYGTTFVSFFVFDNVSKIECCNVKTLYIPYLFR